MSELSERLLANTSKPATVPALLVFEDGTVFAGSSCGARGEAVGEVCFNTALEGYFEVVTDPSYAGQIVAMTYPQIGNYGINSSDAQSERPALRGLVVRDICYTPSSWRSEMSLPEYLRREGVVAIEGVDTRALVRYVREKGAVRAVVSTEDSDVASLAAKARASEPIVGVNLVKAVSCADAHVYDAGASGAGRRFALKSARPAKHKVIAYDCGAKRSILDELVRAGCEVTVVPWDTPASEVLAANVHGVFLSNGPGDPDAVAGTYEQVEKLLGEIPVFGICLGHQMICKAAGARMEKMKYGHHGANQPVVNVRTGRVEITSQNHGFSLVLESLGQELDARQGQVAGHSIRTFANHAYGPVQLTHVNLNDGTPEGIAFMDIPAFSVQYHPEANPGPTDAHYLFTAFSRLMDGRADYLDIDIAQDRLQGWRFAV